MKERMKYKLNNTPKVRVTLFAFFIDVIGSSNFVRFFRNWEG